MGGRVVRGGVGVAQLVQPSACRMPKDCGFPGDFGVASLVNLQFVHQWSSEVRVVPGVSRVVFGAAKESSEGGDGCRGFQVLNSGEFTSGRFAIPIYDDGAAEFDFSDVKLTFLLVYNEVVSFEKFDDAT